MDLHTREALISSKVQINLGYLELKAFSGLEYPCLVCDKDLTMFDRIECSRVDVEVRINLDDGNTVATKLQ